MRRHRLLLPLLLVAASCSGGGADTVINAHIDTVGTRIEVTNTGMPVWSAEGAWRFEEDLRLGSASEVSTAPDVFSEIRSIAVDSRGEIYVLDGMSREIRVFHSSGTYSHTIGRRGSGPGEFSFPWVLRIGPGDTLTVLDDGAMRFSLFAPDGEFLEDHRRSIVGFGSPLQSALDDGSYLDWATVSPDGRLGSRILFSPINYARGFERADTFPPIEFTYDMVPSGRMPLMDYGGFVAACADTHRNIWFANSREYRIFRRSLKGDTPLVLTLPAEAAPLGEAERESVRKRWASRWDIGAEQLAGLPKTKPIIYGIIPDNVGHVYVFVDVAGEPPGTAVDVFRESGEYLGRMVLPTAVPLEPGRPPVAHITKEYLYVVVTDDMDVPYVSRMRIVREP